MLEFKRFKKKMVNIHGVSTPLDEGERRNVHAIETAEYSAAHGLPYIKPKSHVVKKTWFDTVMAGRFYRAAERAAKHGSVNKGTISLGPKS